MKKESRDEDANRPSIHHWVPQRGYSMLGFLPCITLVPLVVIKWINPDCAFEKIMLVSSVMCLVFAVLG